MEGSTDLPVKQTLDGTAVAVKQQQDARAAQIRRKAVLGLWVLGLILLVVASLLVSRPRPSSPLINVSMPVPVHSFPRVMWRMMSSTLGFYVSTPK